MQPQLLFEDEVMLVLAKPAGMVVNRAESVREETVQDWVESMLKIRNSKFEIRNSADENFIQRSGMVHRLDKETSGALLWAKTPAAMVELMRQFKQRETKKEYLALVHGLLVPKEGFVGVPIARDQLYRGRFCVDPMGKKAFTAYLVTEYFEMTKDKLQSTNNNLSLVRLFPKTGRTHQIRVHMKHIGHPLVADALYLSKKTFKRDVIWCPRHFLHAVKIGFKHPVTDLWQEFEAPLDLDLANAVLVARGESGEA